MAGGMYTLANFLDWKAAKTVNDIALLSATTSSHRKTYANLTTTVDYLTTKLSLANKNLLAALRKNNRLKRLLGKFRIGGCTSKKNGNRRSTPWQSVLLDMRLQLWESNPQINGAEDGTCHEFNRIKHEVRLGEEQANVRTARTGVCIKSY